MDSLPIDFELWFRPQDPGKSNEAWRRRDKTLILCIYIEAPKSCSITASKAPSINSGLSQFLFVPKCNSGSSSQKSVRYGRRRAATCGRRAPKAETSDGRRMGFSQIRRAPERKGGGGPTRMQFKEGLNTTVTELEYIHIIRSKHLTRTIPNKIVYLRVNFH